MDDSILAKFSDDDSALGPFLGNLPSEILDVVVQKLGWFQTTFAMASRTCREVVERVPSTRAVLTDEEVEQAVLPYGDWTETWTNEPTQLANAVVEGDVEAMEWLIQLSDAAIDEKYNWRHDREEGGDIQSNWVNNLGWLAAKHGKIESLMCLRANRLPYDHDTCDGAAEGGHLGVLQWARENGCPWDAWTCMYAAEGGHLEMLQWARQNGCPWDKYTCLEAAKGGHLEMLQWARENGCPWHEDTCSEAAYGGHLEVLQWARQNGCPWNEKTCSSAARGGNLEVLQWARENGCPWDENTWRLACFNCHPYLRENGCPGAE
jgi:hypothetical protein